MINTLIVGILFLASAYAGTGHIYVSPKIVSVNKLEISVISNSSVPVPLKGLKLKDGKGEYPLSVDVVILPFKEMTLATSSTFPLGENLNNLILIDSMKNPAIKVSSVILPDVQNSNLPKGWVRNLNRLTIASGTYAIQESIILNEEFQIEFEKDVTLLLGKDVSISLKGSVKASGLTIKPKTNDENWNNFIIFAYGQLSSLENLQIAGGKDSIIKGLIHSCSLCIYGGEHIMKGLRISGSKAEDSLNIKEGKVFLSDAIFENSFSDAFDCDWCDLTISQARFSNIKGDGLDISGTKGTADLIEVFGAQDKGISIGEGSQFEVRNSRFDKCAIGIAVKDSSKASLVQNHFFKNSLDLSLYNKKKVWGGGYAQLSENKFISKKIQCDKDSKYDEL